MSFNHTGECYTCISSLVVCITVLCSQYNLYRQSPIATEMSLGQSTVSAQYHQLLGCLTSCETKSDLETHSIVFQLIHIVYHPKVDIQYITYYVQISYDKLTHKNSHYQWVYNNKFELLLLKGYKGR